MWAGIQSPDLLHLTPGFTGRESWGSDWGGQVQASAETTEVMALPDGGNLVGPDDLSCERLCGSCPRMLKSLPGLTLL